LLDAIVTCVPPSYIDTCGVAELDMDWIHPWIGLDWNGSGFSGNFMDWIGLDPITVIPCFFIYIISILTTDKR